MSAWKGHRAVATEDGYQSQAEVINRLIKQVEDKLAKNDAKATLADYIRLIQLKKELEENEPKEIRVTWIERDLEESSGT